MKSTKPRRKFEKLISLLALFLASPAQSWAAQEFYREFLSDSGIVSVSGEQLDEHHARLTAVQVAYNQYREIRVLNPNTGATEILEFSDPNLQVTYTLPLHGHFLKLQIKRREEQGVRTADLVLASDGSHYIPVRHQFRKYQILHQSFDLSEIAECRMPQSSLINKTNIDPVIDVLLNSPQNVAMHCLNSSCQKPPFLSEYKAIVGGLSQVIASRDASSSKGGTFLSCLNQHNLKLFSENLKAYFSDSLKNPASPSVVCDSKNNGDRGEYSEQGNLTYLRKPWAYGGNTEPESDAASYYADTFFHESLHRAGIEDESIVSDLVSCCGMEKPVNEASACKRVDQRIAETNERNARLMASMDKLVGFKDFWIKIQKVTDDQRVNTLYDDFFEILKTSPNAGGNSFSNCVKTSGKSDDECTQEFLRQTDDKIAKYFDDECPSRFKDKSKSDRGSFCKGLKADAINIVQKSVSSVCDPSKSNSYERSCFFASRTEKEELLAKANGQGDLLDPPDALPNDPTAIIDKKARDAYLTAFAHQIPALEVVYNETKDKINDERFKRTEAMFSSMLSFVGQATNKIQADYKTCIDSGNSRSNCADQIKHEFIFGKQGLNRFFRRVCPTYFTLAQNTGKPCEDLNRKITNAFTDSFSGGCKTEDPAKQIGVPGNDLTCLFNSITEGKYILAHYDEIPTEDKINSNARPMNGTPDQQAKDTAKSVAGGTSQQPKGISIGDQGNKQLARASSGSVVPSIGTHKSYRSPASEQGPAYAFDPSDGFDDRLKNDLRQQPTPVKKVLQDASRVISDMAVPSAEAETSKGQDTSSLAVKAPAPISPYASSIAGDLESTRAINIGVIDPFTFSGQGSRSNSKANTSAKDQAQAGSERNGSNHSPADDRSTASSDSSSSRSPASTSNNSKSSRSSSSTNSSATRGTSAASANPNSGQRGTNTHDSLRVRQKYLFDLFKKDPQLALKKLKQGELSSELAANHIQAKDDAGHVHGSKSPQIKIWYDLSSGIFMGLPDL